MAVLRNVIANPPVFLVRQPYHCCANEVKRILHCRTSSLTIEPPSYHSNDRQRSAKWMESAANRGLAFAWSECYRPSCHTTIPRDRACWLTPKSQKPLRTHWTCGIVARPSPVPP